MVLNIPKTQKGSIELQEMHTRNAYAGLASKILQSIIQYWHRCRSNNTSSTFSI